MSGGFCFHPFSTPFRHFDLFYSPPDVVVIVLIVIIVFIVIIVLIGIIVVVIVLFVVIVVVVIVLIVVVIVLIIIIVVVVIVIINPSFISATAGALEGDGYSDILPPKHSKIQNSTPSFPTRICFLYSHLSPHPLPPSPSFFLQ